VAAELFLFPGHYPQIDFVFTLDAHVVLGFEGHRLFGLGAFHVKIMRDNPRAGFELFQLRHELDVQIGQQIERHHVGVLEIEGEDICLLDRDKLFNVILLDVIERILDTLRVDVVAITFDAKFLGRSDQDASVSTAQIIDDVALLDLG